MKSKYILAQLFNLLKYTHSGFLIIVLTVAFAKVVVALRVHLHLVAEELGLCVVEYSLVFIWIQSTHMGHRIVLKEFSKPLQDRTNVVLLRCI